MTDLPNAALLKAEALQLAIHNIPNFSSIATDAQGVIQIFNLGAERMLGYSATEVVNLISPAVISDASEIIVRAQALSLEFGCVVEPGFQALVFKATRGIEDSYELTFVRKDGSRLPAIVSVIALRDSDQKIIGYLLMGTDNTARKQVQAEQEKLDALLREQQDALRETNKELEAARAAAEKANRAKSEFLSSMSHELRTPLNAVLGFAQLLASEKPPPSVAQQRSLDQILKGGWYLLQLINEILDLAMVESGKVMMSQEAMGLSEVFKDCEAMMGPQAEKRGINMRFMNMDQPFFVHADRTRLKQVLINLLSNAIKYNRNGGSITISAEVAAGNTRQVHIRITDSGFGLSAEQLDQLFQPFNRLGREHGLEEGTGIGLVVTKQLVELMGGAIGVESEAGIGTTFWINLTATEKPTLEAAILNLANLGITDEHAPMRTVLYVEDNPANLILVEQLVARRSNLKLLTATDGHTGVQLARNYSPDVILMDINLPGMNGYGCLKLLQESVEAAHIPVLALSANAMPRDIEKGIEAGFFRYLTKPIKVVEFMEALDLALNFAADHTRAIHD
ncbi:ATP-binding protein [Rugamonas sp.]|uniref:PAS domain-containing hybrid sensor histidine kinase/response regulator n=1 Tax=Rugamonas sp. TaxID=1926287 RepID=UPI0025FA1D40|nr:ATP-binding protein [Rugamonas sp.]